MRSRMKRLLGDRLATRFLEDYANSNFEKALEFVLARKLEPRRAIELLIEDKLV
jgi:hypothetical protein